MSTLQNLVTAYQADETQLRQQAQARTENWQSWLAPVSDTHPTGEDPGYDDDFQRIREEVNKLSGIDTGLICTLAEKLLTTAAKDIRVATYYCWAKPVLPKDLSCWRDCCSAMARSFILSASGVVNRRWSGSQAPVFWTACHSGRK